MNTTISLRNVLVWLLVLLMALPPPLLAQDGQASARKFSQEELDQILAPIALYPDPLIGHILIASTYPLEVVMADRWAKQNKGLKGTDLDNALSKQPWDASVKALVAFPDILSTMSQKLDWTQRVGDAFLAQQSDVMDTVQKLRRRAADAGNLKTTDQQNVIVEREVIRIEPWDTRVVYVPVYDPWWVYGPWWWPAYPPYILYPPVAVATGVVWFGAGLFVGAYWGTWGYWGWHNHACYVYRGGYPPPHGGPYPGSPYISAVGRVTGAQPPPPGGSQISAVGAVAGAQPWRHDPVHRGGVSYRDQATRERYGQQVNRSAMESRRSYRGYEGNWIERGARTGRSDSAAALTGRAGAGGRTDASAARTGRADTAITGRTKRPDAGARTGTLSGRTGTGRADARTVRTGRPDAALGRPTSGPFSASRPLDRAALERNRTGSVFQGIGRGSEVRQQSNRGRDSINPARPQSRAVGEAIRGSQGGSAPRGSHGWGQGLPGGFGGSRGGGSMPGGFGGGSRGGGFGGGNVMRGPGR